MSEIRTLADLLETAARRWPERTGLGGRQGGAIRYRDLAELAARTCDRLFAAGVGPGDRVALCLRKSIDTVAAIVGILEAGAAYVPLDSTAPAERNARILADAS